MPRFTKLLQVAETLGCDDPSMSIVTAHMGFEVAAEGAYARLPSVDGADQALAEAVTAGLPDRTFMDRRTREMWAPLSGGDEINGAPSADAQAALHAVQALLAHLAEVVLARFERG